MDPEVAPLLHRIPTSISTPVERQECLLCHVGVWDVDHMKHALPQDHPDPGCLVHASVAGGCDEWQGPRLAKSGQECVAGAIPTRSMQCFAFAAETRVPSQTNAASASERDGWNPIRAGVGVGEPDDVSRPEGLSSLEDSWWLASFGLERRRTTLPTLRKNVRNRVVFKCCRDRAVPPERGARVTPG